MNNIFSRPIRDRIVDLVAIASAALVVLAATIDAAGSGRLSGDALFWALLVSGAGCAALWWRRRRPVWVALLLVPPVAVTDFVGAAGLIAVYTVASLRRGRVALGVAALHLLAIVPYAYLQPDPSTTLRGSAALTAALLGAAVALGRRTRGRRRLVEILRDRVTRTETEAELREERARSRERERIAREMHDVLAHRISLVSLHAGALAIRSDLTADQVAMIGNTIQNGAHEALEELREILGVLRVGAAGEPIRPAPGLGDLAGLVDECRAAGTPVEVDNRPPDAEASSTAARTAYRIVQEGLTNARKHSAGKTVHLRLEHTPAEELYIEIRNPLTVGRRGLIPGSESGLIGLAERVSIAGGRLDHGARQGGDGVVYFHLEAWIPWPK